MTGLLPRPAPVDRPPPADRSPGVVSGAAVLGLAALLVLALTVGGGAPTAAAGAGPVVDWGLPLVTLAGRITALATVGALLFAAVLHPGSPLPRASRGAVRAASAWALAWAGTAVVGGVLTLGRTVGAPPTALTAASVRTFLGELPAGRAALAATAAALVVGVLARRCTSWRTAGLLLAVTVAGVVVPTVLTGHSAAADDHALAAPNLSVHVVAGSMWVGGLLALLVHGRDPEVLPRVAGRFSAVALACAGAVGATGVLAAWLTVGDAGLPAALGSGYGWLLAGKTAALGVLLAFGLHHRRRTLPDLRAGRPGAFRRVAAVEGGVLLATVALAVALAASPPPAPAGSVPAVDGGPAAAGPGTSPPPGHDHGDLSVPVLVDPAGFTVTAAVTPGAVVVVHNPTGTEVTVTAVDGAFDAVVPAGSLTTFRAPEEPGSYPFASRHSPRFTGVLVVAG
ncbi:CopD family protein [Blastococcus sp. SYSU D00820]